MKKRIDLNAFAKRCYMIYKSKGQAAAIDFANKHSMPYSYCPGCECDSPVNRKGACAICGQRTDYRGNPTRVETGYQQWKAGKSKVNPPGRKTRRTISSIYAVVYVYHGVFDHVKVYRKHEAAKKEWERLKRTVYKEDYDSLHLLQLGPSDLRHVKSTKKGDKWFMVILIFGGVEVKHIIPFTTKKAALGYQSSIMKEQRPDYDDLRLVQVTVQ